MSEKISPQSAGGRARAITSRKEALDKYYANPSICKECQRVIQVQDRQPVPAVRIKKFCNRVCAGKYNNRGKMPLVALLNKQAKKDKPIVERISTKKPRFDALINENRTKGELFKNSSSYQHARSHIARHARFIYFSSEKQKSCLLCGYDKHFHVCHIKDVKGFPGEAKIVDEINHIDNLLALCPTHHWEFDNGHLKI